jgi:hypothetical protein
VVLILDLRQPIFLDRIIGFSFTVSLAFEAIINPGVAVGIGSLVPT